MAGDFESLAAKIRAALSSGGPDDVYVLNLESPCGERVSVDCTRDEASAVLAWLESPPQNSAED